MNKINYSILALMFLVGVATAQQPILHYTFDEIDDDDAIDSGTGEPANGVFEINATRTSNTPGGFSSAALDLSAAGFESWVNGGDAYKVDTLTQFTMTTWLNLQGLNTDQGGSGNVRLLAKQTVSPFDGFSWNLNNPIDGERSVDNFRLGMFVGGEDGFGFGQSTESLGADNRWIFLATTYDGTDDLDNLFFYHGDEQASVAELGEPLSVFAGRFVSSTGRATVNIGHTDAAPGIDFAANGYQDDVRIYDTVLTLDQIEAVRLANLGSNDDINGDGIIDAKDIDAIAAAIQTNNNNPKFDINSDGTVDQQDHTDFVNINLNTWSGDANLDGEFNSTDFVVTFQAGTYETANPATWSQGDFNGDGVFDSGDLVRAFQGGGFEIGSRNGIANVPEPNGLFIFVAFFGLCCSIERQRRKMR